MSSRAELEAFLAGLAIGRSLGGNHSLNIAAIAWDEYQSGVMPRQSVAKMADLVEENLPMALQIRERVSMAQAKDATKH